MINGITIGCVRGRGPISRAIGWFGGGYYSHITSLWCEKTNTVLDSRKDRIFGIPPGVQTRPLEYLRKDKIDWLRVPMNSKQAANYRECLYSQIGKPYDTLGVWNFVTGKLKDRNFRDRSQWFCDDLVVWALEDCGACPRLILPPPRVTPGGAALIACALGAVLDSVPMPVR